MQTRSLAGRYAPRYTRKSAAERFFDLNMGPHDALFSLLSTRELVRLMQTSRRVRALVLDVCFDVSSLLRRFFGSPANVKEFRRMQQQTGTIISGSMGLQFLNRLAYEDSDLDIYVRRATAQLAIIFLQGTGYTWIPRAGQDNNLSLQLSLSLSDQWNSYLGRGIADVLDFRKGDEKIQLIIAKTAPMDIILSFHSTCVMNIITHSAAISLYPWYTFVMKQALIIETVGAKQEIGRQKYIDRGWEMLKLPSANNNTEIGVRIPRSIGDSYTWTIPLPPLSSARADLTWMDMDMDTEMDTDVETRLSLVPSAWMVDCSKWKAVTTVLPSPGTTPSTH
ncbi:hypothetical protein R3P38DRAFT_2531866 [Favolaschia claudopus]|uniref:F-box domain-containing protein n=1 Tax=Favolaschia claudopus TaxID=2862362 RepID=A0AAW0BB77_9AGAR